MQIKFFSTFESTGPIARSILLGVTATAIAACAGTQEGDLTLEQKLAERNYVIQQSIDRIQDYRINGWYYVDDYNVVFQGGPSEYYLLTFNQRCLNLRGAHTIAFTTTVGRVTRFDKVLVKDQTGLPAEQCIIEEMHKLRKLS